MCKIARRPEQIRIEAMQKAARVLGSVNFMLGEAMLVGMWRL
jgi:hypothetical protein